MRVHMMCPDAICRRAPVSISKGDHDQAGHDDSSTYGDPFGPAEAGLPGTQDSGLRIRNSNEPGSRIPNPDREQRASAGGSAPHLHL
jgi:hypothetical protein